MLRALVPNRSKPLLGNTSCWKTLFPAADGNQAPYGALQTLGPREFRVGYWMSPLLWQDILTTAHRWDCTRAALKFGLCWNSSIAVIEGGEQVKQVHGDEKLTGWFWTPQRNAASCSESPFGVLKDERKEQENQKQSKAGYRAHRWIDIPSSFSGSGCPS